MTAINDLACALQSINSVSSKFSSQNSKHDPWFFKQFEKTHLDKGDPAINLHVNEVNLDMIGSNNYLGSHLTFATSKISRVTGMLEIEKKTHIQVKVNRVSVTVARCLVVVEKPFRSSEKAAKAENLVALNRS